MRVRPGASKPGPSKRKRPTHRLKLKKKSVNKAQTTDSANEPEIESPAHEDSNDDVEEEEEEEEEDD